jgi:hypothetical protein
MTTLAITALEALDTANEQFLFDISSRRGFGGLGGRRVQWYWGKKREAIQR